MNCTVTTEMKPTTIILMSWVYDSLNMFRLPLISWITAPCIYTQVVSDQFLQQNLIKILNYAFKFHRNDGYKVTC